MISDIITNLNKEYVKEEPLTVTKGLVHEYLGMPINYIKQLKAQISTLKYICKILDEAPKIFNSTYVTPEENHLFEVNKKGNKLDENEREISHHFVEKVLFLTNRARQDIKNTVLFLCTRVKSPDQDNWKKLGRMIRYL